MSSDSASARPPLRPLVWVCAAFAGAVLLHADRLPAWACVAALALVIWRLVSARGAAWYPGIASRTLLALALVAVVLARFHTLNGLAAGTTLLLLMAALKLLETRGARDQMVMVGAALFLLLAACLDRQDLWRTPLYALEVWLCCAALAVIGYPQFTATAALRLAGRALLLALPLALLLFVFFPRLAGAFWAIPRGEEAQTGLSDSMSPGSILKLTANYDPAFRAQFFGPVPPAEERYWRGPVLHDFDGRTWRTTTLFHARQPLALKGIPYRYRVALEPSRRRWWFALDTPAESPDERVLLTADNQLLAADPVVAPVSYEALSYTHTAAVEPLAAGPRRQDTQLPPGANPRTRALAQQLRARSSSEAAFVQAVLDFFATGGFVYSLEPERLGPDPVDDFLFNTREGFCGHYASAFAVLMRFAGVPVRVVTGYLGGEWNPIGGYFVVHQSDAHAWAEVWLAGRGWTRIDPTAVVAPERLRRGIFDLLPDSLTARERLMRASPWLQQLLQRWDAANSWWSEHVVKFDYAHQLDLLSRLGIRAPDARTLGWAFIAALCGWLTLIAWHVGRGARSAGPDALGGAYLRLCSKLARRAVPRLAHQGPLEFAATVRAARPDLAGAAVLLERYARLRYGAPQPGTHTQEVESFRRAVARLQLPRAPRPQAVTT